MSTKSIKVPEETYDHLKAVAEKEKISLGDVVKKMVRLTDLVQRLSSDGTVQILVDGEVHHVHY